MEIRAWEATGFGGGRGAVPKLALPLPAAANAKVVGCNDKDGRCENNNSQNSKGFDANRNRNSNVLGNLTNVTKDGDSSTPNVQR